MILESPKKVLLQMVTVSCQKHVCDSILVEDMHHPRSVIDVKIEMITEQFLFTPCLRCH